MASNSILRLFRVLAGASQSGLRQQVQFLKAENEILRAKIGGPIRVTARERSRLVRLGKPLGPAIRELITIVSPRTFARWIKGTKQPRGGKALRRGRPRTATEIRRIVLRIAKETGFGYTRILGELKKLGIRNVSRSTVVNILRENGLPTGPQRGEATWAEFLKRHAKTLWACDFLTTRVLTPKGLRHAFSLVFIHPSTRRAHVSTSTTNPDAEWFTTTVQRFIESIPAGMARPRILLRDRDGKFRTGAGRFDRALVQTGINTVQLPRRSPNLNAYVERLIQSIELECLDHFIVLGTRHLDHLLAEYIDYHNRQRPHSSLNFAAPMRQLPKTRDGPVRPLALRCRQRLGGVLKHYHWKAA